MIKYFQEWGGDFDATAAKAMWKDGAMPFVDTEPKERTLQGIVAGKYDYEIRRYAGQIRDSGVPVAYSFGHEFNGWWYTWGYCTKSKGLTAPKAAGKPVGLACQGDALKNTPQDFANAWKHVHDVFEEVGATNVIWVWSPNAAQADDMPNLKQFYPGPGYVDWIGVSGYMTYGSAVADATPNPDIVVGKNGVFYDLVRQLKTFAPTTPIIIAETGSDAKKRKVSDIQSLIGTSLKQPQLIGFVWFDVDKKEDAGNTVNYAINSSPKAWNAWKTAIRDPKLGGDPSKFVYAPTKAAANGN
jgi:mannan endo-1,4-beta-mannosidase